MPRGDIAALAAAHQVKVATARYVPLFAQVATNECIPTGITMLNLALSGRVTGGIKRGSLFHICGDSDAGKSVMAMTLLAQSSLDSRCSKYELYKDDAEASDNFVLDAMFGSALVRRLKHPGKDNTSSYTIEEFYDNHYRLCKAGRSFISVLDSMDGLESHSGIALFEENMERRENDKETKASYGDGKAKYNSQSLRKLKQAVGESGSLLVVVSQTRDNISPVSMAEQVHAGGRALKFYSTVQLWLANRGKLTKMIHGKEHQNGVLSRCRISKNHITGRHIDFLIPFYFGYGIDDIQCSLRWLCDPTGAGIWKMGGGKLTTHKEFGLDAEYKLADFVHEARKADSDLAIRFSQAIQQAWDGLEKELRMPGRFSGEDAPITIGEE